MTGKFLSKDPTRYAAGDTNLQRYVGNNPVNLVDPNGHEDPRQTQLIPGITMLVIDPSVLSEAVGPSATAPP